MSVFKKGILQNPNNYRTDSVRIFGSGGTGITLDAENSGGLAITAQYGGGVNWQIGNSGGIQITDNNMNNGGFLVSLSSNSGAIELRNGNGTDVNKIVITSSNSGIEIESDWTSSNNVRAYLRLFGNTGNPLELYNTDNVNNVYGYIRSYLNGNGMNLYSYNGIGNIYARLDLQTDGNSAEYAIYNNSNNRYSRVRLYLDGSGIEIDTSDNINRFYSRLKLPGNLNDVELKNVNNNTSTESRLTLWNNGSGAELITNDGLLSLSNFATTNGGIAIQNTSSGNISLKNDYSAGTIKIEVQNYTYMDLSPTDGINISTAQSGSRMICTAPSSSMILSDAVTLITNSSVSGVINIINALNTDNSGNPIKIQATVGSVTVYSENGMYIQNLGVNGNMFISNSATTAYIQYSSAQHKIIASRAISDAIDIDATIGGIDIDATTGITIDNNTSGNIAITNSSTSGKISMTAGSSSIIEVNSDIEFTDALKGVILKSRSGTKKFRLYIVDDTGTLAVEEV